jgi:hypothetical protein
VPIAHDNTNTSADSIDECDYFTLIHASFGAHDNDIESEMDFNAIHSEYGN